MRHMHLSRWTAMAIACSSMIGAARAGQLPQELVSQYRPAVERLRDSYTHVSVEGILKSGNPSQGKSREVQFEMRASGQLRRLDTTTIGQQRMGLQLGGKEMQMATPWGSLSTYTPPGHKFFKDAQQIPYDQTVSEIDRRSLLNYPYSLDSSGTILDMLLRPGVKVTRVNKVDSPGNSMVQITYEETAQHAAQAGLWKSSVVLSPAEGWALVGFSRTMGQGSGRITQRAKLTYSGVQNGIPLVRTIESETVRGESVTRQEAVEVSNIKFGAPDRSYFGSYTF